MRAQFLREPWVSEHPAGYSEGESMEIILNISEGNNRPTNIDERNWLKILNMSTALDFMNEQSSLSVEMTHQVNLLVSEGLFDGGKMRQKDVGAAYTVVVHLPHQKISKRLSQLVEFVIMQTNAILGSNDPPIVKTSGMLKLGALFFAEFLFIHPYLNGNGRTARILLQYILKNVLSTPFSLYLPIADSRDQYLRVLMNAQFADEYDALATYCLAAAFYSSKTLKYLLEI